MRKLSRDEERFKSCLKKSKDKALLRDRNSSGQAFWYFPDVEQTGWHPDTIGDLIRDGLIEIGVMWQGHYRHITWKGK
jgi:hypothetical protein